MRFAVFARVDSYQFIEEEEENEAFLEDSRRRRRRGRVGSDNGMDGHCHDDCDGAEH
jgi:hypothetical protein